jgi:hypothetical protein
MQHLCYNLYGFQDWSNNNMRGKKHVPNDLTRQHVDEMTAKGATQPMVAGALGIEEKCLRRHYRDELDGGTVQADMAVAGNLFRIATSEGPGAVTAAIFWLKTRAGWREIDRTVEVAADQPITIRWATEADALERARAG